MHVYLGGEQIFNDKNMNEETSKSDKPFLQNMYKTVEDINYSI